MPPVPTVQIYFEVFVNLSRAAGGQAVCLFSGQVSLFRPGRKRDIPQESKQVGGWLPETIRWVFFTCMVSFPEAIRTDTAVISANYTILFFNV